MLVLSDKMIFMVTSIIAQALRVMTTFVMARLVLPREYGLLTMVAVAPSFISALGDCGIARGLVQFQHLPTEIVEASGLLISVALALIYSILWMGSGLYFATVEHDSRLIWIGAIGGVTTLLTAIYTFQMACLNRDLKFRAEARQNLIYAFAQALTGISLALAGWGLYALALQPLAAQIVANVMIYRRHPFRAPTAFQFATAGKMLNYGWKVSIAQYVNNLQLSVVNTFVGFAGGAVGLGVFGRAQQVSDMVGQNTLGSFDRLLHPLLTSVRENEDRLRGIFTRGCIATMLFCTFGWAMLVGEAPDLIRVVMGPRWDGVPELLRIYTATLGTAGLGLMAIVLMHALGKPLIWLRYCSANVTLLVLAAGTGLFIHKSVVVIVCIYVVIQTLTSLAMFHWSARRLKVSIRLLIGHLIRLCFVAAVSVAGILEVRHLMMRQPAIVRLIAGGLAGSAAFLCLAFLLDRAAILEFRTLVQRRRRDEPPSPPAPPVELGVFPSSNAEIGHYDDPVKQ